MRQLFSQKGITLLEVMIALTIITLLIATLLPTAFQFREREANWRIEMQMEQEAIRFFTYLENRNACLVNFWIDNNRATIEVCNIRDGLTIKRRIYQDRDRLVEEDTIKRGYIIMAFMVQDVQFYQRGQDLLIKLILKNDNLQRSFTGILSRGIK